MRIEEKSQAAATGIEDPAGWQQSGGLASWREELRDANFPVLRHTWLNRNARRFCLHRLLRLYLTDSAGSESFSEWNSGFDASAWLKGEAYAGTSVFHLPQNLPPGVYNLPIDLVGPEGRPHIKLSKGSDGHNRYMLGTLRVLPTRAKEAVQ